LQKIKIQREGQETLAYVGARKENEKPIGFSVRGWILSVTPTEPAALFTTSPAHCQIGKSTMRLTGACDPFYLDWEAARPPPSRIGKLWIRWWLEAEKEVTAVAEHEGCAGGARRWWGRHHLAGQWFSVSSDGSGLVKVRV
jgi:hypothetical protein